MCVYGISLLFGLKPVKTEVYWGFKYGTCKREKTKKNLKHSRLVTLF